MSTTDIQNYINDWEWWFPPQRVHLEAHDEIQPVALFEELECSEGLPDYSDVPHGSTVEVIAVPVIEEVFYEPETLWMEYM